MNIVAASLSDTTNSSNVTFTFSEAPGASFTDSDVVTAGGTLSALVMDTPTTYHATFTATDGVTTTGSVSVAAGAYTDPVGNLGGAGSDTVSIDTQNPTVAVNIVASSLNSPTNSSNVTFVFSEPVTGFAAGDVTASHGTLSGFTIDNSTQAHVTFTADSGFSGTGSVSVTAGSYTDIALNTGSGGSDTVAINTTSVTVTTTSSSVTVNEGSLATNGGTYNQPDGHTVTITPSVGTVVQSGTSNGTWSWSYTTHDGLNQNPPVDSPDPKTVTITFTDTVSSGTTLSQFPLTVNNVPPTIAISGNAHTPEGAIYFLALGAITDPGTDTVSQWTVHWGDGQTSVYTAGGLKSHIYADGPQHWRASPSI